MAESKYSIFLNNDQLRNAAKQSSDMLKGIGDSAEAEGARIDRAFKKAAAGIGISLAGISAAGFVKQMFKIRSEFQDTESAMTVFLGSVDKSAKFMKELQNYAWYNMFEFSDLTKESAKLLAFRNNVEDVIPILDKLSNVAAGTKQPLGDLVDMYNKAKNIGKVDEMGLKQWATSGLVVTDVLKDMGVEVDRSAIKFEHLEMALNKVTSEGGMFHNLMGAQLQNLSASVGQLQDSISIMFNELGQKSEGFMKGAIDSANYLVENYEKLGKVILELVAAYGAYRVALAVSLALQQLYIALKAGMTAAEIKHYAALVLTEKAQKLLNATMLKNPYVLAAAAIVALGYGMYKLITYQTEAEKAQKRLNKAVADFNSETTTEQAEIKRLFDKLEATKKESKNYQKVKDEITSKYGSYLKGLKDEVKNLNDTAAAYRAISVAARQAAIDRAIDKSVKKEQENYDKNIQKANENLLNQIKASGKMSEGQAEAFFEKIQMELLNTGKLSDETSRKLEVFNRTYSGDANTYNSVKYWVEQIVGENEKLENAVKNINLKFGVSINQYEGLAKEQVDAYIKAFETAMSKFKQSGKNQKIILFDKELTLGSEEELDLHLTKLKEVREAYNIIENAKEGEGKKNKEYWEGLRDETQSALDLLEEGEGKWYELIAQRDKANKALKAWAGGSDNAKQNDYTDQIKRETQSQTRAVKDLEFAVEHARISALEEGAKKIIAQNKLNYEKEKEQLKRQQEDMLQQKIEFEKTKWLATNPKKTKEDWDKSVEKASVKLTDTEVKDFDTLLKEAEKQRDKDNVKALQDQLERYRTFAQKRLAIEKQYRDEIAKLKEPDSGATEENIQEAEKYWSDMLAALDEEVFQKEDTFQEFMMRIAVISLQQLEKSLADAEKALKESELSDGANSKKSAVIRAKIKKLQTEIKTVKAENAVKESDRAAVWNKTASAIKKTKSEVDGIINSMDFLDDATKAALRTVSNIADGAINMINGIKMLSIGAATSISTVEKASVILAIVGAAIQIITAIFSAASAAEKRHQEALEEVSKNKLAFQRKYNLLLLEQNLLLKEATTIFGTKDIEKSIATIKVYMDAISQFKAELKGPYVDYFSSAWAGAIIGWGAAEEEVKKYKAYMEGIGALQEIKIKTGHEKTGLFGWGKGRDIYASILDVYGKDQLLNPDGTLNIDFSKTILDTQTLSDANRELLQNLIDLQEEAEKALEQLRDYLKEAFGVLGGDMIDSITESIRNKGVDAWEEFGKAGAKVIEKLGEQLAYEIFFADKFNRLQKDLENVYKTTGNPEELALGQMEVLGQFYQNIGSSMDAAKAFMENWQKEAEKYNLYLWNDIERQASEKGFASMTQDTASELNGRFTAIQAHTYEINENLKFLVISKVESNAIMSDIKFGMLLLTSNSERILRHLAGIESNTKYCENLEDMNKNIESMRYGIDNINLKGVKISA